MIKIKHFCSYIIQNFADSFRQSVIDLMQGNLTDYTQLTDDDVLDTLVEVAKTALVPTKPPPLRGYFNVGVFGAEARLAEDLIYHTRSEFYDC